MNFNDKSDWYSITVIELEIIVVLDYLHRYNSSLQ